MNAKILRLVVALVFLGGAGYYGFELYDTLKTAEVKREQLAHIDEQAITVVESTSTHSMHQHFSVFVCYHFAYSANVFQQFESVGHYIVHMFVQSEIIIQRHTNIFHRFGESNAFFSNKCTANNNLTAKRLRVE